MSAVAKVGIFEKLQGDILRMEGFRSFANARHDIGLGPMLNAFPNATFPIGAVHEFLAMDENISATSGFITALISSIAQTTHVAMWIGTKHTIFPPGLNAFNVDAERMLFVHLQHEKDVLWTIEEALKSNALSSVVADVSHLDFTSSRRLQLAVEQSQVTGFLIRTDKKQVNATASVARWKVNALPSDPIDNLPGVGFPSWRVELLRVRNGKPGVWELKWRAGKFYHASEIYTSATDSRKSIDIKLTERKAG